MAVFKKLRYKMVMQENTALKGGENQGGVRDEKKKKQLP